MDIKRPICDTGAQQPSCVVFGFLIQSHSTLHLLPNTFYTIKTYTRLNRTIKQVKKANKNFKIFGVITILCNHHFILQKLFWAIKGFILYQNKRNGIKIG